MNGATNFRTNALIAFGFTAAMLAFLGFILHLSKGLPDLGDSYRVRAVVPYSGAQLVEGARVTMGGVEVGHVEGVERRGAGAMVTMKIDDNDDGITPLPADTRVQVRSRTPLGENYMALTWGRSKTSLKSDDVLPVTQAEDTTEVDQLLSVLKGKSKERARALIGGAGRALDGRGEQLNDVVGGAFNALYHGGHIAKTLEPDRVQLAQLSAQLGDIARTIGARGEAIDSIARDALTTFRAVAASDDELRDLVEVLPGTLRQLRSTGGTLETVTAQAAPVLSRVGAVLRDARPTAVALRPAGQDLEALFGSLDTAAPLLSKTLSKAGKLSGPTVKALPQLRETLCQIDPMLEYLGPYTPDITDAVVGLNSAANAYDAIGHTIRLAPVVSENSLVGLPDDISAAAKRLVHSGLATRSGSDFNWNPYPRPKSAKAQVTDGKSFLGPEALADGTYFKYPRITKGC